LHVCTVINKAWLAQARGLSESVRAHQPGARMSVLILDSIEGYLDPEQEPFDVLAPSDLELQEFAAMSARYDAIELCCALKPSIIRHLLSGDEPVVYLDSDVRMFAPLTGLDDALREHPFLLTPHLLAPLDDDGHEPNELAILLAGSFNLGFAAARSTPEVDALLHWWDDRLRTGSRIAPERGMVFDQRWADLMPGIFEHVGAWRDPGVNFGFWRAASATFGRSDGRVTVDDQPLRTFHFTGYQPERPERLSTFDNRTSLREHPVLADMCEQFARRLRELGHGTSRRWPYDFASTYGGLAMTPLMRDLWDRAYRSGALAETPFERSGEMAFLLWLSEPEDTGGDRRISRYLASLSRNDETLRERFPRAQGPDREALLSWADDQAERFPDEVLGALRKLAERPRQGCLKDLLPHETLDVRRGDVVVCIPVYGAPELLAECLTSVLASTPTEVQIVIADDASPDPAIGELVRSLAPTLKHTVHYLRQPQNLGFPQNVNAAFTAAGEADVVVLNSDCVVADGWLDGLRSAAYSDALVATASALTNHGTILSVPERNRPQRGIPQQWDVAHVAGAVRRQSPRYYPTLPTAIGHCVLIRRQALDLVGGFDPAFSPGYGEEVDFSQRCVLQGLIHVAADDVFVLHHAGGSFATDGEPHPIQAEHERIIEARYPYYLRATAAAAEATAGRLPRAIASARRAIKGFSVTIDGRCLGPLVTGTQVHTLQLINALDAVDRIGVRVIVPPDLGLYASAELAKRPGIELIAHTDVHPAMHKSDVAHRPYQVNNTNDLLVLSCAAERQVITHQDLIAYRNPGYFAGYPQWERHRRLTREALTFADRVVFFSRHALKDAMSEDLVEADRASVVYIGVDHAAAIAPGPPAQPPNAESLSGEPFLLCLGTDFRHKNRMFALRLVDELLAEHGWRGKLVLAGPRVSEGSSAGEEAAYLATRPELARAVSTLPAVSEQEKSWLLENCVAVLYPTTYEGFGLMPFEAADHGRPCLFASHTALAELLPGELASLVPWDVRASARRVNDLLSRPDAMQEHVHAIRRVAGQLTWRATAELLINVYFETAASAARESARMAQELAVVEAERDELQRKYTELYQGLTPEARMLIAPGGPLSPATQRSLIAVVSRPLLRRLLLGPVALLQRLRHGRRGISPAVPDTSRETFDLHFEPANVHHMREQLAGNDTPPSEELQRADDTSPR
jgi:GT2 family glycosyltransferase/glycosyltransferase involved in cell wall biosynthesis